MASVVSAAVVSGELIIGLDDGSIIRAGYVQGPQGLKGDQGPLGATGPAGVDGNTLHTVEGIPDGSLGRDGDYAIDRIEWRISGPKAGGRWPQFVDMLAKGKGKKLGEKGSAGFGVTGGGGGGGGSGPGGDVFTNQVIASATGRLAEVPIIGSPRVLVQYPGSPNGIIPPSGTMGYQSNINAFIVDALDQLDMGIPVPTASSPPTRDVYEGKLWFDSEADELTLYIRYGGNWVPAAPPVSLDGIETAIANIDEELLKTNAQVAIINSKVDELRLDVEEGLVGDFVTKDGDNELTGDNKFTGNTVFEGKVTIPDGTEGHDAATIGQVDEAREDLEQKLVDEYLPLTGGTLSGPLILPNAVPRFQSEATTKDYVDDADEVLQLQIAALLVSKGSDRTYECGSLRLDIQSPPRAPGEFHVNTGTAQNVTQISMYPTDKTGVLAKVPAKGDIIEFDEVQTGDTARYVVMNDPTGVESLSVIAADNPTMLFTEQLTYKVFVYPQNEQGVTQDQLDQVSDAKVDRNGDIMTGPLTIKDADLVVKSLEMTSGKGFDVRTAGLSGESAFSVRGNGKVKAGPDSANPFMASDANDLTTKAYVDKEIADNAFGGGDITTSGNVHIIKNSTFGNIDKVPFVISQKKGVDASLARYQIDGKDVFKIAKDGSLTFVKGIELQGVEGQNEVKMVNMPPAGWSSSKGDFTLTLDLTKNNTYHNKFAIEGNSGQWLWYSSGTNNVLHMNNLNTWKIRSGVSSWESETPLKYANTLSGTSLNSMSPLPREAFDDVLADYANGKYSSVRVDRSNQSNRNDPGVQIKSSGPNNFFDLVMLDSSGNRKITLQTEGYSSGRPYIHIGTAAEPGFSVDNEAACTVVQAAAPARMAWRYTSSNNPGSGSFYYSSGLIRVNYSPRIGGVIKSRPSGASNSWTLNPNTYYSIWTYDYSTNEWNLASTGHVNGISYQSYGLQFNHDELFIDHTFTNNETCYITVGGFLS